MKWNGKVDGFEQLQESAAKVMGMKTVKEAGEREYSDYDKKNELDYSHSKNYSIEQLEAERAIIAKAIEANPGEFKGDDDPDVPRKWIWDGEMLYLYYGLTNAYMGYTRNDLIHWKGVQLKSKPESKPKPKHGLGQIKIKYDKTLLTKIATGIKEGIEDHYVNTRSGDYAVMEALTVNIPKFRKLDEDQIFGILDKTTPFFDITVDVEILSDILNQINGNEPGDISKMGMDPISNQTASNVQETLNDELFTEDENDEYIDIVKFYLVKNIPKLKKLDDDRFADIMDEVGNMLVYAKVNPAAVKELIAAAR